MAHILLEPSRVSKGVLVIKHSEAFFYHKLPKGLREALREKFYVGVYFGYYTELKCDMDVDFYVADNNVLRVKNSQVPRMYVNGINFIVPDLKYYDEYNKSNVVKDVDFLVIGNSQKRKNLTEVINVFVDLAKQGKCFRAVVINRISPSFEGRIISRKIRKSISKMPRDSRRNLIYLEQTSFSDMIPRELVFQLMKKSRALICPSRVEGAARVVGEAVLMDMIVFSNKHMKGGTNNYLDGGSDYLFNSFSDLQDKLCNFVDIRASGKGYVSKNKFYYTEEYSKEICCDFLVNSLGLPESVRGEIHGKSLINAFSGHQNILPEKFSSSLTDEVLSVVKLYKFISYLSGVEVRGVELFRLAAYDKLFSSMVNLKQWLKACYIQSVGRFF